jgi:FkbM family methyltransferase
MNLNYTTTDFLISISPRLFDFIKKIKDFGKKEKPREKFFRKSFNSIAPPIKVMQIGANDGIRSDPLREFIIDFPCKAIFIEADPVCFKELQANYSYLQNGNLFFENLAVVPEKQQDLNFYTLSEEYRKNIPYLKQLKLVRKASTDKSKFVNYLKNIEIDNVEEAVNSHPVPSKTLSELVIEYFEPDVLVIDTEGLDWSILDSLDFSVCSPKMIFFELGNPDKDLEKKVFKKLKLHGYAIEKQKFDIGCLKQTNMQ